MPATKRKRGKNPPLISKLSSLRTLWVLIFLGLAVHILLPQFAQLGHLGEVLSDAAGWAVALSLIAQVLSYVGSGYVLMSLVAIFKQTLSLGEGMLITLAAYSTGMLGGGWVATGAVTYRWLRGLGIRSESAGLGGSIPLFLNNVALIVAATLGLLYLLFVHQLSQFQIVAFALVLAVMLLIAGAAFWGARNRQRLEGLAGRVSSLLRKYAHIRISPRKLSRKLRDFFASWDTMLAGKFLRPVMGAFLNVGFDALTLYFLFVAVGAPVNLGVLLAGYGLPLLLAKVAFVFPGGIGVIEATMAALYASLGVDSEKAIIVVLGYRIFSFWIPLILGFPAIIWMRKILKTNYNS